MNDVRFHLGRAKRGALILTCLGCATLIAGCGGSDASIDDGPPAPEVQAGTVPNASGAPGSNVANLPPSRPGVPPPAIPRAIKDPQGLTAQKSPSSGNARARITPPPPVVRGAAAPEVPKAILDDPNR